ncbi:MAG: IS630 family transposase [Planctomycetes bacterium]|nr:IS630 family transposase [Planctomycetota bacterium]
MDLWSLDEVHFQQYGSRCRMWIPPEAKDPVIKHFPGRKSVGYFGAVRIRDGKFVYSKEEESFNAVTFWEFLKKLHKASCHSGRRVVVISDNVRYHHALIHKEWREERAKSFCLEFMPPYSPELNPIERVWKITRRKATHNRFFPTISSISSAIEAVFNEWSGGSDSLRRLCAII